MKLSLHVWLLRHTAQAALYGERYLSENTQRPETEVTSKTTMVVEHAGSDYLNLPHHYHNDQYKSLESSKQNTFADFEQDLLF